MRAFKVIYSYISIASIRYITLHKNTASLPVVFSSHASKPSMVLVNSSWHAQKTYMCVEWPAAIPSKAFISYSFTTGLTKPYLDAISKKNSFTSTRAEQDEITQHDCIQRVCTWGCRCPSGFQTLRHWEIKGSTSQIELYNESAFL